MYNLVKHMHINSFFFKEAVLTILWADSWLEGNPTIIPQLLPKKELLFFNFPLLDHMGQYFTNLIFEQL